MAVQFLVQRFSFWGVEGQAWMLVVVGLIAAFLFFFVRHRTDI
jgi:hypothetical protein